MGVRARRALSGDHAFLADHRSSKWFIILTVSTAVFTDVFLYGIIVPVLPFALQTRASVAPGKVQDWVAILLAIYGASMFVTAPLWGFISDRLTSRMKPFVLGLILLAGATALICVGSSIPMLIVGRILQGASAGLVWTIGLALLVDTIPDSVGMAMGYVGLAMSVGTLLGPLLGGVVYSKAGYYPVFAMALGLLALDIVLRISMIEKRATAEQCQAQELSQKNESGHDDETPDTQTMEDIEPQRISEGHRYGGVAPTRPKTMRRLPVMVQILCDPRLLSAVFGTLVHAIITTSFDSTLPLQVASCFEWDSLAAGLIFLPLVIPSFLGPIIGAGSDRYGPKYFAAGGFLLAVVFLVCLRFVTYSAMSQKVLLCVLLFGVGTSMTLALGPLMADIAWAVEAESAKGPEGRLGARRATAQGYGLMNMAFSAGAMVGPIMGGFIRQKRGFGAAGWALAILSGVSAAPVILYVGGPLTVRRRREREHEADE